VKTNIDVLKFWKDKKIEKHLKVQPKSNIFMIK